MGFIYGSINALNAKERIINNMNIQPQGMQLEVLALPTVGHFVVLGTAGSGKTTIAMLRAKHLGEMPGSGRVLLLTFNGALVEYMKGDSFFANCNVTVDSYHKFARGYMAHRGKMDGYGLIANNQEREKFINKALCELQEEYKDEIIYKRQPVFFMDEIKFIQEYGCDSSEKYIQIERTGRSATNLRRDKRLSVYRAYRRYLDIRTKAGFKYDWYDLAYYVYQELRNDDSERLYKHIIIDEGQDFSPMMIKSIVDAIPINGSFTFFGDVAQQIYGNRISWKESGIKTNKIWRFGVNYRNPNTIIEFSRALMKSDYWKSNEYMVECEQYKAQGPKPVLIKFDTRNREKEWVIERAIAESIKASVVIICRNREDINDFAIRFNKLGHKTIVIDKHTAGYYDRKQIYLSTFHAAKGLEFYNVFIPHLSDDKIPDAEMLKNAISTETVYYNELKLLYVAVTRSRYGLYMSYSGNLTPLFPIGTKTVDMKRL